MQMSSGATLRPTASFRSAAVLRPRMPLPAARRTHAQVRALQVGDQLPSFELQTDESSSSKVVTIKSQDIIKDAGAVIFIYPKANTSGCTIQACGFNDNMATFNAAGYKIYGLSADTPEAQASWKQAQGYKYPLLCDPEFKVLPQLCGAAPGSKITRTHIVVEQGGKVSDIKLGVASKESVPDALKFIADAQLLKKK